MVAIVRSALAVALMASTAAAWSSSFTSSNGLNTQASTSNMSMKIFDWKARADTAKSEMLNDVENTEFTLDNLAPAPGSRKRRTRKGRGIAAGQGASCGFGMRGQKARSGPGVRKGFEGGQQPLYRRLPKFVGRPTGPGHTKTEYNIIKLDELNGVAAGETVNYSSLFESKMITKSKLDIHKVVVGRADFTAKDITVQANAFTKSAREAIEAAGGKCQLLKRTTGEVIEA
mmetsp:Transcript_5016/g.7573  ORF Transcript_5016/g.7573 Transcript_5016/m.7573 type:complete len:230 (+) Transcript_5016:43-732(+)|eukprot:CAMPEP_0197234500 /NCGR_PEP_ID=MMETSP1429-20130617/2230_1 /TAXON_ID=49237 /ORGANISM="Chaetoceros  sp., Strain UNC1202" /LENGTH=229 /DNA_ID=CAMNT_0042692923 /DNA_START=18 /DNA_END=707 /DNA_ORIENTATION=+